MPEPTQRDFEWATRLWGSLAEHGRWILPGVGIYVRTEFKTMTLSAIHMARPADDAFGNSVFDKHDWIVGIGEMIGWEVNENILDAYDEGGDQIIVPDEAVGDVALCNAGCGAIFRVEPLEAGKPYVRINMDGLCPICGELEAVDGLMRGIHVVIDETAVSLKAQRMKILQEAQAQEEEE